MIRATVPAAILISILPYAQWTQGAASVAVEAQVQAIRIGRNDGRTRVVFDLSNPVSYQFTRLENPARVVIDLPDSNSRADYSSAPLQGTPIVNIRTNDGDIHTLSYVFTIESGTEARLFTLEPYEDRGHRLILDLYPAAIAVAQAAETGADDTPPHPSASNNTARQGPTSSRAAGNSNEHPRPRGNSGELSGYVSFDTRLFFQSPAFPKQDDQNVSMAFKPEYYIDWASGEQQFAFSPFFRYDANDDQRTHADIRELYWQIEHGSFIAKAGLDVVFWGVTESQHLVDIINQTDLVENIDGEEKLGQPMLNLDYLNGWGNWQLYVLPYFRERTYPGKHGRLRTEPAVNTRHPEYESGSKEKHVDFALRWSHNIGDWDIGLGHFSGTSREPLLLLTESSSGNPRIVPRYLQIDQTSLDVQATKGAWLWKLEAIYNSNNAEDYYAYVGGLEYTNFGVAGTAADLGFLLEYNYVEREDRSTTALQDDIYVGLRLTGNDVAGTRVLAGIIVDTDTHAVVGNIEAARRLSEAWTLELEIRFFSANADGTDSLDFVDARDDLYFIKADDYVGIQLLRYF